MSTQAPSVRPERARHAHIDPALARRLDAPGTSTLLSLAVSMLLASLAPRAAHAVDPGSQLIGCDQADDHLTISVSSHLDPSCTWTRGVDIVASDVVFDCQGAHIAAPDRATAC
jgi:hypothetical protein